MWYIDNMTFTTECQDFLYLKTNTTLLPCHAEQNACHPFFHSPRWRLYQTMPVTHPQRLSSRLVSSLRRSLERASPCCFHGTADAPLVPDPEKGQSRLALVMLARLSMHLRSSDLTVHPFPLCSPPDCDSRRRKHRWNFLGSCLVAIWSPHALHAVCRTGAGLPRRVSGFLHSPWQEMYNSFYVCAVHCQGLYFTFPVHVPPHSLSGIWGLS